VGGGELKKKTGDAKKSHSDMRMGTKRGEKEGKPERGKKPD